MKVKDLITALNKYEPDQIVMAAILCDNRGVLTDINNVVPNGRVVQLTIETYEYQIEKVEK